MKKLFINSMLMLGILVPAGAQPGFLVSDFEPVVEARIPGTQVPSEVLSSIDIRFDRSNPLTWSKFPMAMAEYGWVYDMGEENNTLEHFEVTMKTDKKGNYWAMYSRNGELMESREESVNAVIPADVIKEFSASAFNDWKIIESKEVVRFFHDSAFKTAEVKHQFRLTVEKDGAQEEISFKWKGAEKEIDYTAYKEIDKIKNNWLVNR